MKKIFAVVACLTLALGLAQSMPAVAQSRLPLGLMPSNPLPTPNFNNPGPQIVPPVSQAPLPTDPPMGSLGIR
jgi:hypothetical protein